MKPLKDFINLYKELFNKNWKYTVTGTLFMIVSVMDEIESFLKEHGTAYRLWILGINITNEIKHWFTPHT